MGREGRLPSLAVGSSLPDAHSRCPLLPALPAPQEQVPLPQAAAAQLLFIPPAPTLAFRSFLRVGEGADSNSWEKKDITGLIFPMRGKGL